MEDALSVLAWPAHTGRAGNPYIDQLTGALESSGLVVGRFTRKDAASGRWDVCHVHWPEWAVGDAIGLRALARVSLVLTSLGIGRVRGMRICWTVHNVSPHDQGRPAVAGRLLWWAFPRLVSGAIVLTEASRAEVISSYPVLASKPFAVVPHGTYVDAYPQPPSREVARSSWGFGSEQRVAVFFGQIRAYKGADRLVSVFASVGDPDARLLVAGAPKDAVAAAAVTASAGDDDRVGLVLRTLTDEEVSSLAGAADVFVLPYRRVLNSGAALLALSLGVPVLVPSLPTFDELAAQVGSEWVMRYEGELGPEDLDRALADAVALRGSNLDLSALAWPGIGKKTAELYALLKRPSA